MRWWFLHFDEILIQYTLSPWVKSCVSFLKSSCNFRLWLLLGAQFWLIKLWWGQTTTLYLLLLSYLLIFALLLVAFLQESFVLNLGTESLYFALKKALKQKIIGGIVFTLFTSNGLLITVLKSLWFSVCHGIFYLFMGFRRNQKALLALIHDVALWHSCHFPIDSRWLFLMI